jgi:flagellar protein FlaE
LQAYLRGFDGGGDSSLTIDHHTQSLKYISQLNGGGAGVGMMGGGLDGLQR